MGIICSKKDCTTCHVQMFCQVCNSKFSFLRWKYQCFNCGRNICSICSNHKQSSNQIKYSICKFCIVMIPDDEEKQKYIKYLESIIKVLYYISAHKSLISRKFTNQNFPLYKVTTSYVYSYLRPDIRSPTIIYFNRNDIIRGIEEYNNWIKHDYGWSQIFDKYNKFLEPTNDTQMSDTFTKTSLLNKILFTKADEQNINLLNVGPILSDPDIAFAKQKYDLAYNNFLEKWSVSYQNINTSLNKSIHYTEDINQENINIDVSDSVNDRVNDNVNISDSNDSTSVWSDVDANINANIGTKTEIKLDEMK